MENFIDLKELTEEHHGTPPPNFSMTDPEMTDLFGKPDLITEHHRPTIIDLPRKENKWGCGDWWKFYYNI